MPDPVTRHDAGSDVQALDRTFARIAFSTDGTILRANALCLDMLGYRGWDLLGRNHAVLLPADGTGTGDRDGFWDALLEGEGWTGELRRLRADGSEIWVQASYAPVAGPDGHPCEIVAFLADITARKLERADDHGQIAAINTSQAVIHFTLDGVVSDANDLFLQLMGYDLPEVAGRHHRMFVDPAAADGEDYAAFWRHLADGGHWAGECRRYGKDGREIWLQATYNPIFDMNGRPFKIVKYAVDLTAEKLRQADHEGQIAAIHKSLGVITFDMDGTVLDANDRFLDAMGYRLDEIEGRHHRMFVDPSYAHGSEYASFWNDLVLGRHQAGEYRRLGKDGREVWLQATYNPVFDQNGRPFKVVKYATVVTREKLRQADHQGQIASIHKAQCVISFGLDGTILDANDNFLALTGYRLSQVRGRHHRMFVDSVTMASEEYGVFWASLAAGRHQAGEFKRLCRDGREVWLRATYNPIFDMNGRPFKVVKYASDVTQEKLRQADHEGQIAAIRKSQCVIAFDMDGTILDANDTFLAAMGYGLDEVLGRHHRMFVEAGFAESDEYGTFWDTLRQGLFLSAKYRRIGKDGREVWIQASYNPILDLNGQPFKVIKLATDVTADVALAADLTQVRRQVQLDPATGLPNRLGLASFMATALREPGARLALLYLDLDHFKPINDTFGHDAGDDVLRETATRLRGALGEDQIVARVGGDEFVVAVPGLSDEEAEALCGRLITLVKEPIRHEKGSLSVGLSIGVALAPGDASTTEDLLRCADVALYRSKGTRRGSYSFFAAGLEGQMTADRHLAHEMHHGIKAGQFGLVYRPRFDALTRMLDGAEAVIQWLHPERGLLQAEDFVPLAEKSGLILPVGEWMLRNACHDAAGWPGLRVCVDVSPVQLTGCDLPEIVGRILAETGMDAGRLELQIATDLPLADIERIDAELGALKALGVRLAVHGQAAAGAGHRQPGALAIDAVGIDRDMRADLERQGRHAILGAITEIETSLGISATPADPGATDRLLRLRLDADAQVHGTLLGDWQPASAISALLAEIDGTAAASA